MANKSISREQIQQRLKELYDKQASKHSSESPTEVAKKLLNERAAQARQNKLNV